MIFEQINLIVHIIAIAAFLGLGLFCVILHRQRDLLRMMIGTLHFPKVQVDYLSSYLSKVAAALGVPFEWSGEHEAEVERIHDHHFNHLVCTCGLLHITYFPQGERKIILVLRHLPEHPPAVEDAIGADFKCRVSLTVAHVL